MLARTYENQVCSVAWALEVVGERWTLLIMRDALLGFSRFGDFRDRLGVAASVLAVRLERLVTAGVLQRVPYQERPRRYEYRPTPMGDELTPVVISLMEWGNRHLVGVHGPPQTARHRSCGSRIEIRFWCPACGEHVGRDDIHVQSHRSPDHRSGERS